MSEKLIELSGIIDESCDGWKLELCPNGDPGACTCNFHTIWRLAAKNLKGESFYAREVWDYFVWSGDLDDVIRERLKHTWTELESRMGRCVPLPLVESREDGLGLVWSTSKMYAEIVLCEHARYWFWRDRVTDRHGGTSDITAGRLDADIIAAITNIRGDTNG